MKAEEFNAKKVVEENESVGSEKDVGEKEEYDGKKVTEANETVESKVMEYDGENVTEVNEPVELKVEEDDGWKIVKMGESDEFGVKMDEKRKRSEGEERARKGRQKGTEIVMGMVEILRVWTLAS